MTSGPSDGLLALSLPAPNPVRGSMAYSLVLPRDARVQVRVLDLDGRVVRTLVDETPPAGRHGSTPRPTSTVRRRPPRLSHHSSPCGQCCLGSTVASPSRCFMAFALAGEWPAQWLLK
jgi:hypothetical protein